MFYHRLCPVEIKELAFMFAGMNCGRDAELRRGVEGMVCEECRNGYHSDAGENQCAEGCVCPCGRA